MPKSTGSKVAASLMEHMEISSPEEAKIAPCGNKDLSCGEGDILFNPERDWMHSKANFKSTIPCPSFAQELISTSSRCAVQEYGVHRGCMFSSMYKIFHLHILGGYTNGTGQMLQQIYLLGVDRVYKNVDSM